MPFGPARGPRYPDTTATSHDKAIYAVTGSPGAIVVEEGRTMGNSKNTKDIRASSLTGTSDAGEPAPDPRAAFSTYVKTVRAADGSNDPETALAVGRAAARVYARTMKWLAGS